MGVERYSELVGRHVDGRRAQAHVRALGELYRSPGSSGYAAAIDHVAATLAAAGVETTAYEVPIDGRTEVLGSVVPPAWDPAGGTLEIVSPVQETLVVWDDCPSCLPWWCPPTPPDGVELEVVDVGTGERDEDFASRDVRGKAVLVHDSGENFAWFDIAERAARFGAAGLVSDYLLYPYEPWRTRDAVPDAVQQLRLPYRRDDNPWTFTVAKPAFDRLVTLVRDGDGPVRLRFTIDARTYAGRAPYVVARIPGADDSAGGIAFVAHVTAATKPGANCASGVALMLELAAAMTTLAAEGEIVPRRPIYFLFGNEGISSTHWFEQAPEARDLLTTIAFCSVGHDQAATRSSLIMSRSPDSRPTFMNDLLEGLMEQAPKEAPWAYREGSREISLVHTSVLPYTPWSDNATWAKLGVPSLLFMSLPDRYFHTQLLTPDKTDPAVFERCGRVTGGAVAFAAIAGGPEAREIMLEVAAKSRLRLSRLVSLAAELTRAGQGDDGALVVDQIAWMLDRDARAVRSTLTLLAGAPADERDAAATFADALVAELEGFTHDVAAGRASRPAQPGEDGFLVPRRTGRALPHGLPGLAFDDALRLVGEMAEVDPTVKLETLQVLVDELWNLSGGEADLAEITRALGHEFSMGLSTRHVRRLAEGLQRSGHLELAADRSSRTDHSSLAMTKEG